MLNNRNGSTKVSTKVLFQSVYKAIRKSGSRRRGFLVTCALSLCLHLLLIVMLINHSPFLLTQEAKSLLSLPVSDVSPTHCRIPNCRMTIQLNISESWNFNSGNYLFTTDTKQIHVSKFYCTSLYSPALCTTRCQRCGSRRIPLAAPVVLIVRMERSTA